MIHTIGRAGEAISLRIRPIYQTWGYLQLRFYGKSKETKPRNPRPNRRPRLPLILTEQVPNLGVRGELVRVKHGYGRNYLLPKNKAVYYTPENIKLYNVVPLTEGETRNSVAKERIRKLLERTVVRIEVNEEGDPVLEAHISYVLRTELQLQVPLDCILLSQPIKTLGDSVVNIKTDDSDLLPVHVEVVLAKTDEVSAEEAVPAITS